MMNKDQMEERLIHSNSVSEELYLHIFGEDILPFKPSFVNIDPHQLHETHDSRT